MRLVRAPVAGQLSYQRLPQPPNRAATSSRVHLKILLSQRVNAALKGSIETEQLGALTLRGLTQPVIAFS